MSNAAVIWYSEANEDGPWTALNRVCSLAGSGEEAKRGEGPLVQVADISTITCKVFELAGPDEAGGSEVTPAPTLTSANIYDTLSVEGWAQDDIGWNFRHDIGADYFAAPDTWRLIEYKITLTGGEVIWIEWRVYILPKATS